MTWPAGTQILHSRQKAQQPPGSSRTEPDDSLQPPTTAGTATPDVGAAGPRPRAAHPYAHPVFGTGRRAARRRHPPGRPSRPGTEVVDKGSTGCRRAADAARRTGRAARTRRAPPARPRIRHFPAGPLPVAAASRVAWR